MMSINTGRSKPPSGTRLNHANPVTRDLVVYYPMNEGAGIRVNNVVENKHHGQFFASTAGVPLWDSGPEGLRLRWPPEGNYGAIEADGPGACNTKMFSYMVWCGYESKTNYPTAIGEGQRGNNTPQCSFYFDQDNTKMTFDMRSDAGVEVNPAPFYPLVADGAPHTMVLVGQGSDLRFYIDGVCVKTSSIAAVGAITTNLLRVGGGPGNPSNFYFRGWISQAAVWKRPIDEEDILSLHRFPYSMLKLHGEGK